MKSHPIAPVLAMALLLAILMWLCSSASAQTQHFIVDQGLRTADNKSWKYKTDIKIDCGDGSMTITEFSAKATYNKEKSKTAKRFGESFNEDFTPEVIKAEKIINDLMNVSTITSWKGISVGDSIMIPEERVGEGMNWFWPDVKVTGFIFRSDGDVFVRFVGIGQRGSEKHYAGEFFDRVKLIKKAQKS